MKKFLVVCVTAGMLSGLAWAGGKDDEVARTMKACGKPLADRVDSNPSAAGGKERLLRYKGIELSYQKVDGLWVFWGGNLPVGISNLNRAQTAKNLPCFHDVEGLRGVASPMPMMPKNQSGPVAETQTTRTIDLGTEANGAKLRKLRMLVIGAAACMMLLSLIGWVVLRKKQID